MPNHWRKVIAVPGGQPHICQARGLVEQCWRLDVDAICWTGLSHPSAYVSAVAFAAAAGARGRLTISADRTGPASASMCVESVRGLSGTDRVSEFRQYVEMVCSQPHFGGVRWWFICPESGARCRTLFLPIAGDRFVSRQALGLTYQSQQMSAEDRAIVLARRIRMQLGGATWRDLSLSQPPKPKWMRWKTYSRLATKAAASEYRAIASIARRFGIEIDSLELRAK